MLNYNFFYPIIPFSLDLASVTLCVHILDAVVWISFLSALITTFKRRHAQFNSCNLTTRQLQEHSETEKRSAFCKLVAGLSFLKKDDLCTFKKRCNRIVPVTTEAITHLA